MLGAPLFFVVASVSPQISPSLAPAFLKRVRVRPVFSFVNTPALDSSGSFGRTPGIGETSVVALLSPARVIHPDDFGPRWAIEFSVSPVIPGVIKRKLFQALLRSKAPRKASDLRLSGRPFCGRLGGTLEGGLSRPGSRASGRQAILKFLYFTDS